MIRKWETLHPYNFVDVLELSAPVQSARLAESASETLNEMLGISAAFPLERGIHVEEELARAFSDAEAPVRIRWESAALIAFTFRHACFDGVGAATFVKRTIRRAFDERMEDLTIDEPRERIAMRHLFRSVRDLLRMRHVHSRGGGPGDSRHNLVRFIDFDPSLLERLRADAASHQATINDVLATRLAAAMRGVGPPRDVRRSETSVAIAVGMRLEPEPFARNIAVAWFPVFAGDEPTLQSIRDQTAREKRTRAWMRSRMEMRAASLLWPWIAPSRRDRYLARQYVVTAGLTNLRLDGSEWIATYRRAVATGPVAPLVVSALTVGERLSLAITWRATRFRNDEIDAIESVLVI